MNKLFYFYILYFLDYQFEFKFLIIIRFKLILKFYNKILFIIILIKNL